MFRSNNDFFDATGAAVPKTELARPVLPVLDLRLKRAMDIAGALLFFTLFLPLYLAVAVGVLLTSRGPIFYSQERIGLHGRSFRFWKFRSMVQNSEEVFNSFLDSDHEAKAQWEKYQKLDRDPRITWFGHFIRRTSLDELPQFWNVLIGDMSIVGPRPCMPKQKNLYGAHWKAYCAVRPGLTGLWQVSGRNRLTYGQRVELDSQYVRNWSIWLDLRILARTLRVVLTGDGSK
jgi:Undecaprenyl-phosphate galactose phosphotransferase WbaP